MTRRRVTCYDTSYPRFAEALVIMGAIILVPALLNVRNIIRQLPAGPLQNRWQAMAMLIWFFILAYLGYLAAFWNAHNTLLDLIVPTVFFSGVCFVWLTAALSLQTALDVLRVKILERETYTDSLSGLCNRRYLDRRLKEEIQGANRYGLPLSVLLIDADHFKQINDNFGHQVGDKVLVELRDVLSSNLRESDVLARYGGEGFMVIAVHTNLQKSRELAERLRKSIETHNFELAAATVDRKEMYLTVSIGAASFGQTLNGSEKLIHADDENLYRAKQDGRNHVVVE